MPGERTGATGDPGIAVRNLIYVESIAVNALLYMYLKTNDILFKPSLLIK